MNNINEKMNLNTYPPDKLHYDALTFKNVDWRDAKFNHPKPRDKYTCNEHFDKLFKEITE